LEIHESQERAKGTTVYEAGQACIERSTVQEIARLAMEAKLMFGVNARDVLLRVIH
jgi:hypothetical protein